MSKHMELAAVAAIAVTLATSHPGAAASPDANAAYFIIEVDVKDPQGFKTYAQKATEMVGRYGGTFVVMGGRVRSVEGRPPAGAVVMIRFDDYDMAERWLDSKEYGDIKTLRHSSAETRQILAEALKEDR
jgi:uncharacterized protein (DUF1330 family)